MRTVLPFLAMGPVPTFASKSLMPPAISLSTIFGFLLSVDFCFDFLLSATSSVSFLVSSSFSSSFFSSTGFSIGFPSSPFCFFLFFFSLFESFTVSASASASRGRFSVLGSSWTSSSRLGAGENENQSYRNTETNLESLKRSSGCISTSELTSRRSYASSSSSDSISSPSMKGGLLTAWSTSEGVNKKKERDCPSTHQYNFQSDIWYCLVRT